MTACCLHLGELEFDDSTFDENGVPCKIKNPEVVDTIARLLGAESAAGLT
jgi:hypothetical protein